MNNQEGKANKMHTHLVTGRSFPDLNHKYSGFKLLHSIIDINMP